MCGCVCVTKVINKCQSMTRKDLIFLELGYYKRKQWPNSVEKFEAPEFLGGPKIRVSNSGSDFSTWPTPVVLHPWSLHCIALGPAIQNSRTHRSPVPPAPATGSLPESWKGERKKKYPISSFPSYYS